VTKKRHVRILSNCIPEVEVEVRSMNAPILIAFLDAHVKDIEYRLRYAALEETKVLQGSLRALDDIRDLLETS